MKKLILVIVAVLLAGCGGHRVTDNIIDPDRLELAGAQDTGLDDPMESQVVIKTDWVNNISGWTGFGDKYLFRGYIDKKTLLADYQLYVETVSYDWMFWDSLKYLGHGDLKQLNIIRVSSDVQCYRGICRHAEDHILKMSRNDINDWVETDTSVRLVSSKVSGNVDIVVKKDITANFLNAMDKTVTFIKNHRTVQITPVKQ